MVELGFVERPDDFFGCLGNRIGGGEHALQGGQRALWVTQRVIALRCSLGLPD